MAPTSYATFGTTADSHKQTPEQSASCWSRTTHSWVQPLMTLAHHKQLDRTDLWPLKASLSSETAASAFAHHFERDRSIPKAFMRMFGTRFVATGVAFLTSMLCNLVGPVTLHQVISALTVKQRGDEASYSINTAVWWVAFLFVSQVLQALVDNYANFTSEVIAIQFVAALKNMLYRKTTRLSAKARKNRSTGDITNMYTSDSDSVLSAAFMVHQAWLIPLQLVIVSYILARILGVAALAGIAVITVMLVTNKFIAKRMFTLQRRFRNEKDERMKKTTELFKSITVVKLNGWEEKFGASIAQARAVELAVLLKARITGSVGMFLMWGMPVFISIAAFGMYTSILHHELTPAIVFTSLALFQLIQMPLRMVMQVLNALVQATVALERVSSFLELEELSNDSVQTPFSAPAALISKYRGDNIVVAVEDGDFAWDDSGTVLAGVNLHVRAGELLVIHGPVGCGKSSLCSALLGEMIKSKGSVYVGGSIGYCSQQPWIQNMTVRDNILFGSLFNAAKYAKVLDVCALSEDLRALPAGDETEIGERGVNLSGGQKARIALARACYSAADILILDSPLAAVDVIVQNDIFNKCFLRHLKQKTVILVTHNPEIIRSPFVTRAITITSGGIEPMTDDDVVGTLVESHSNLDRAQFTPVRSPLATSTTMRTYHDKDSHSLALTEDNPKNDEHFSRTVKQLDGDLAPVTHSENVVDKQQSVADVVGCTTPYSNERGRLIENEHRAHGRVSSSVYSAYYRAVGGLPIVALVLLSQLVWQALQIGSDFWLSMWSDDSLRSSDAGKTDTTTYRLAIYSLLGVFAAATVFARTVMITVFGMHASQRLFDKMTSALLHAPLSFFDANPIGRLLTRYGGDTFAVDVAIPGTFGMLLGNIFSVGCSAVTAAVIIQWKGLLLLPVVFIYFAMAEFYITPARELERLSKTTQAPILNHLSETVDGGSVLRAFGSQQLARFFLTNNSKLDENSKTWYAKLCVSQWFSLRIQLLGSMLLLVVTSSLVLLHDALDPAIIGLAFSYALRVSANLENIVRVLTQVETLMISPERIQEYTQIEQEAPARLPLSDPTTASGWPTTGSLLFNNVDFRYKNQSSLVLRGATFEARGGQKIGIVGRTGAGKSSLTMALFRINELAGGSISIDGVDISKLGLTTLRERLSIIPQHPVLFKGTLRSYLDPFDEFSDEELWRSVDQVGLRERVSSDELKLLLLVEENGENFSVGERQMLCMARALLRNSKIVVFDEATAAIDHETDQKLQGVIRSAFKESTVLTIAHRLDTILDSDRVLVLDGGKVVAFASPKELVTRGEGHFYELMREANLVDQLA